MCDTGLTQFARPLVDFICQMNAKKFLSASNFMNGQLDFNPIYFVIILRHILFQEHYFYDFIVIDRLPDFYHASQTRACEANKGTSFISP